MCGRFSNSLTLSEQRRLLQATGPDLDWAPSWNICPTQQTPVMLGGASGRRLGLMRWGWNPVPLGGRLLINARGEEVHQKPLFRDARERRRCILPASGFYEWQPATTKQERPQPYAFAQPGTPILAIAGLWEMAPVEDGGKQGRAILLTVPANDLVAPIHDRMPLVLGPEAWDQWLDPSLPLEAVMPLIQTSEAVAWRTWKVDRALSTTSRNGPEAVAPLEA